MSFILSNNYYLLIALGLKTLEAITLFPAYRQNNFLSISNKILTDEMWNSLGARGPWQMES